MSGFSCNWCNGEKEHQPWCQLPRVELDEKGEPHYWVLRLNKYQRDNLLWLFNAIGYPCGVAGSENGPVEPFQFANTGDWVGEVSNMLSTVQSDVKSNKSLQEMRDQIEQWVVVAKVHLS